MRRDRKYLIRLAFFTLHRHLSFLLAPFLLIFAVSTLIFNHATSSQREAIPQEEVVTGVELPELEGLELGRALVSQVNRTGEIEWVNRDSSSGEVLVLVSKPTERSEIRFDPRTRSARIETRRLSGLDRILYLHKKPGPHVASIRGNWWYVKLWRVLADFSVIGVFLLTATGLYLWWKLPDERRGGIAFLGAGIVAVHGIILWMVA